MTAELAPRLTRGPPPTTGASASSWAACVATCSRSAPDVGANFGLLHPEVRWTGLEPHPATRARLRRDAVGRTVLPAPAEAIPLEDGSVDAVLATVVLCSVRSPERAVAEVCRVLRPGGRFVFFEHVAAPRGSWRRARQRWSRPLSRLLRPRAVTRAGRPRRCSAAAPFRALHLELVRVAAPTGRDRAVHRRIRGAVKGARPERHVVQRHAAVLVWVPVILGGVLLDLPGGRARRLRPRRGAGGGRGHGVHRRGAGQLAAPHPTVGRGGRRRSRSWRPPARWPGRRGAPRGCSWRWRRRWRCRRRPPW